MQALRARQARRRCKALLQDGRKKLAQGLHAMGVLGANHHTVRVKRIVQRCSLAQEFGVGNHRKLALSFFAVPLFVSVLDERTYPVAGANRHRGLIHDHQKVVVHRLCDRLGGLAHIGQVSVAIRQRRCADRNEHHIRMSQVCFLHTAHKAHPAPHLS